MMVFRIIINYVKIIIKVILLVITSLLLLNNFAALEPFYKHFLQKMDVEASGAQKFTVVDYVVFSLMLVVSVGIGVYSSLRGKGASSTQAFLLGGRDMSLTPVAFSLTGGVISAISILGKCSRP